MRRLELRPVPGTSPVHRLRPDAKVITIAVVATAFLFFPSWPVLGLGWALVVGVFVLARLPLGVIAPPPPLYFYAFAFGALFGGLSGGDPIVAGLGLGGLLDFLQLMVVSLLVIAMGAVMAWTTPLSDIGIGLSRLVRPLRRVGLPGDELATVVMLAARSLPLVRDELRTVIDARAARPVPTGATSFRGGANDAVDFGTTVLVGVHRRARELARAMVARNSVTAPVSPLPRWRFTETAVVFVAIGAAAAILILQPGS